MKIAFDYQTFTNQSYGGISRYYTYLASNLARNNDIKVIAGIHKNNYLSELPRRLVSGFKVLRYPPKTGKLFQLCNHLTTESLLPFFSPDIIHETYYSSLPVLKSKALRVASVYDMIHEIFPKNFGSGDHTSLLKRATFARVDHIISISNSTKNDLVRLFDIDESKISVVHLGVDASSFRLSGSEGALIEGNYILYVGSRFGYKNFSGLIKAYSTSAALKREFKVVAFGGGAFSKNEMSSFSELGLDEKNVKQIDGTDEMLKKLYSNASVFVYPSVYEGFGLPPLEAMASGCPVVSSNTSSMPEVVNDAGIYFDPENHESIRNAVESVVFSKSKRDEIVAKGFDNVKLFTWDNCASNTLSVYKKLLGNR